jgi:uncharacterized membrane protein YeaQ/YmgE (transglycosylase-associated protein family)
VLRPADGTKEVIGTIILGLIAGWITGLIMRGSGFGVIADIVIGLVGAIIGRFIFAMLSVAPTGSIGYVLMSVIGAIVLVSIVHVIENAR